MTNRSCKTCYMAKKSRPNGTYLCEYYGLWVKEVEGCMIYTPKA
ncbi:MAG: hypothetical protein N3H31_01915 [Candidatus Nezhaarchaeota archaeon]|nr:hypothetical protein [Candidatus Nezhaarchaeota archaeon]